MRYTYFFVLAFIGSACAGDVSDTVRDYLDIHKLFYSIECADSKTQTEMDACGEKVIKSSERKMNKLFNQLQLNYKSSEPGLIKDFNESQKQWALYANANCKVETWYSREGSAFQSIWNACMEAKINERISYLAWLSDNP